MENNTEKAETVIDNQDTKLQHKSSKVFYISIAITLVIVAWGLIAQSNFEKVANAAFDFLVGNFGWFYLISVSSFVIFSIWIAFSKYGKIKLGKPDEEPEYSTISWFAMLFSAGMGVGLVFWGVAEPLNHFVNPLAAEGGSSAAVDFALTKSFLHWGLHPWANYAVLALALAYMQFRRDKPGLISSIFIPLIGEEKVKGPIGKGIDVLAIFATVAGVATSLGMATLQMTSGFNFLFGVPETDLVRVIIITVVTILFMISAVSGLDKGIKILSNTNVALCGVLMLLGLILGPKSNGLAVYGILC
jgi:glycine betaine transporter